MPDDPRRAEDTRAWLLKAEDDLRGATIDLGAEPPLLGDAAFHCQQAVEKSLKAFLDARLPRPQGPQGGSLRHLRRGGERRLGVGRLRWGHVAQDVQNPLAGKQTECPIDGRQADAPDLLVRPAPC